LRKRKVRPVIRIFLLVLILVSAGYMKLQYDQFQSYQKPYPGGSTIAGVPVGGLTRQQAEEQVKSAYSLPVELLYQGAAMQILPDAAGFQLDLEKMLSEADMRMTNPNRWDDFWTYLHQQAPPPFDIPLEASDSPDDLSLYLNQVIAPRYDQPATAAIPYPGTLDFVPGKPGTALDTGAALAPIQSALLSLNQRQVNLPTKPLPAQPPDFNNLKIFLRQTIKLSGYDGLLGLYLLDLKKGDEYSLLYQNGQEIAPDVAFTASSTIKIPIMISAYRKLGENPDPKALENLHNMISYSTNPAADWLMENVLDPVRGPLLVTEDVKALGLKNTFLAGYFYEGAPLLETILTPANTRTDISTDPDIYSQTTPSEIGALLADIYGCAYQNGGALMAVFPGEITSSECQQMIENLVSDHLPELITKGLPEGTRIAHKHGWVSGAGGVIHNISDAGIVFTPGGDYVFTVFLYHPVQLVWEPADRLIADLSRVVYNYFNGAPQ
jgi:beta-lactamase class A